MATQTKKMATKSTGKSAAPAKSKKPTTTKSAGAGPAVADRSKDAHKTATKSARKPATKAAAKPGKAASAKPAKAPAKTASKKPSLIKRVARSVAATATGAVELAASVVGMGDKKSGAKKS